MARYVHSSTTSDNKLCCVFGGIGQNNAYLNTIEILNTASLDSNEIWQLVLLDTITARILPVFYPLSATELVIMGGQYRSSEGKCKVLSSVHIVDIA